MKKLFLLSLMLITSSLIAQQSLNINLLYNWYDSSLVANTTYGDGARYNEVWGVAINDREYAIIGSTMGTHFIDVTDPVNSIEVDFIPGAYQGTDVIHRDYHDYNGYLYMVCDEGLSSLQIADLNYLPDSVHVVYDSDILIRRAHNIFIDTATATLYGCSVYADWTTYSLKSFSLADPTSPTLMLKYFNAAFHDIYVRNDTGFGNVLNDGVDIFDFSDTLNALLIGSLDFYPEKGLNHSGWLSENSEIYAFTDEDHGMGVKICDVSDLSDITILSIINSGVNANSIAHNLIIKDNYLYISYYHDGLYIYDISDPSNPVLAGYYDTYSFPDHLGYRGAWGVFPLLPSGNVLVSDMQFGLFVFDVSEAVSIRDKKNISAKPIKLYPNPTSGKFTVANATGEIAVYDLFGRKVLATRETEIDMSSYPAGIYIWQVGEARGKVVKE